MIPAGVELVDGRSAIPAPARLVALEMYDIELSLVVNGELSLLGVLRSLPTPWAWGVELVVGVLSSLPPHRGRTEFPAPAQRAY